MAYQAEISRSNPSMFLFLLDQSGSMEDKFGGGEGRKHEKVADVINKLLFNLTIKCAKSEGVRDYYHIGVIGYGQKVAPILGGVLSGKSLVPISDIADNPLEVEVRQKKEDDGAGGIIEKQVRFPIWFKPRANGGTPMCEALELAHETVEQWLVEHPHCFPPIVINITDGESTDGDPVDAAEKIQSLRSTDGSVLLFNVHLSSISSSPIEFPYSTSLLLDPFAKRLFSMSSVLPTHIQVAALQEGYRTLATSRGFVFNADAVALIRFLDIGTRPSNLR